MCEQGEPNAVNSNRPSCRSSLQKKALIHQKVRDVVLKTLAPKEVKYDYIFMREAFGYVADGLPVIDVDLSPGGELERKKVS